MHSIVKGKKVFLVPLFLAVMVLFPASAVTSAENVSQTSEDVLVIGVKARPGVGFPVGAISESFSFATGGSILGSLSLPFYPPLSITVSTGYGLSFIKAESSLSTISLGPGLTLRYMLLHFLGMGISAEGGYSYNFVNTSPRKSAWTPYVQGGVLLSFFLSPQFSLGVEGAYRRLFGLYQEITVSLGVGYYFNLPREKRSGG